MRYGVRGGPFTIEIARERRGEGVPDIELLKGGSFGFFSVPYSDQHRIICRHSDCTVSEDAGIEPRIAGVSALAVRITTRQDLIELFILKC
jgi:hypothetical protein